ncbi:MAG: YcxB family protein [Eubacterium sp.]|nr:YcxB family protein [Eubacterium sp.]
MKTEFDIQLKPIDMYRYNLYHAYTSASGYLAFLAAAIAFAGAARTWGKVTLSYTVLYLALGVVLLLYTPVSLYLRSKQQVEGSPVLKHTLHYVMDDTGVTTSQGEASSTLRWDQVYRVVATRHNILVCINPRNAFIIPRDQVTGEYGRIREIAKNHLEKYRFKMKE